ncbi:hypothetical protein CC86DRAFT_297793 [Ophiobolus disseminans]|uniref:Expansin-like EG45 domain-containing protein n=1 Tax=Ophiobolus disseminans TaxID=1469910 RepID=A0A6A6ZSQ7_9PLEO|nr:hypothetical protein CC86DRAFT_297793 [Ophiobolus disseminans]
MKTTILALLPLASLALAGSSCKRKTATSTKYDYETVTVTPVAVQQQATPKAGTCSRRTVTTTEVERVTVTVGAGGEPIETVDVTSTSTLDITTTITVRPSKTPLAASSSLKWGNYPNATYHSSGAIPSSETPASSTPSYTPEAPSTPKPATEADTAVGSKRGIATFYGGNTAGGECSFKGYTLPSSLFGTAIAKSNYAGASACGQCVSVTGPSGKKITAMVTDSCPSCGANQLDLYADAFKQLSDPSAGEIPVSWDFVPCNIASPLVLKNKEGTSKYWFSVQVMNANVGVSTVEVSVDGGASWKATQRQEYNYFENPAGFGTDSVDIRVTGVNGKVVVVKGVSVVPEALKTAGGNL